MSLNERSKKLQDEGREIFRMGLGQSPFPVPETVVEALRVNAHQKDYLPVKGLLELREAVAEHHERMFQIEASPEDVLVGPGSKELMFILQLVYYGDLVIPTPTWVSYAPQAQIVGRQVRFLPTGPQNGWRLTAEQLDALCREDPSRPRIVILNYPGNPTGLTYSSEALQELGAVAKRYRLILLSDEIYAKLHHTDEHASVIPVYPQGSIYSGGLSKWCGAGGWRLGLFVFPTCLRWLSEAMAVVASETFTSTSAPIQYAACAAFQESDEIDEYLHNSRRILRSVGRALSAALRQAGVSVHDPQGAFYLFPDFGPHAELLRSRGITTSVELCERLLSDTGVALLPGRDFGRPPEELTARIAYVNFDGSEALDAAERVMGDSDLSETFLEAFCPGPLEAVERICEWLST